MIPNVNNDHVNEGLALLTDHFRKKPITRAILAAFLEQLQLIETAFWQVFDMRMLENADTDQLNKLGSIVGETRQDRTNDDYRAAIKLRIRVNRSQGRTEDLIEIARLAFGADAVRYYEGLLGGFAVVVLNVVWFDAFARMIGQAKADATYGVVIFTTWGNDKTFFLDSDYGGVTAGLFSSAHGGSIDYRLASARMT